MAVVSGGCYLPASAAIKDWLGLAEEPVTTLGQDRPDGHPAVLRRGLAVLGGPAQRQINRTRGSYLVYFDHAGRFVRDPGEPQEKMRESGLGWPCA